MKLFEKNKLTRLFVLGATLVLGLQTSILRAQDHEVIRAPSATAAVVTGAIIKVKENKNEIYVRTEGGQRVEIYLNKSVRILKGTEVKTLADLKKGTNVKVTGKALVEILQ